MAIIRKGPKNLANDNSTVRYQSKDLMCITSAVDILHGREKRSSSQRPKVR